MEYLTLQDIPHRHCNPVHSHRMASQSSERPVTHMAAVCDTYSSNSTPTFNPFRLFLPPHQPLVCYGYASCIDSLERAAAQANLPPKNLREIILPEPSQSPHLLPASTPQLFEDDLFHGALEGDMDPFKRDYALHATRSCSPAGRERYISWYDTKITSQNHLQRSSPPLQPGEQNFPGKLPSFDEVSIVQKLRLCYANPCSSSKRPLREHHHTHHPEETSLRRTLRVCAHSLMM